jgi:hypothetical protein
MGLGGRIRSTWRSRPNSTTTSSTKRRPSRWIPLARATEPSSAPVPLTSPVEASDPPPQFLAPHPLDPILAPLDQAQLNAFLVERNQLAPGQTHRDLNADYASRILTQPARFLATAGFAPAATA